MNSVDELAALSEEAIETFVGLLERARADQPPEHVVVCRAGCPHCCYQPEITVTAIEVFRVADFIFSHFTDDEVEHLLETLPPKATTAQATLESSTWSLKACPLLRDGSCSVYAARPLLCHGGNSYDASDCERARTNNHRVASIWNYGLQERAGYLTQAALRQGITDAGRQSDLLDLAPALAIALREPNPEQRWLDGEPVFANARARLES